MLPTTCSDKADGPRRAITMKRERGKDMPGLSCCLNRDAHDQVPLVRAPSPLPELRDGRRSIQRTYIQKEPLPTTNNCGSPMLVHVSTGISDHCCLPPFPPWSQGCKAFFRGTSRPAGLNMGLGDKGS